LSADAFAARAAELGFPLTGENIRTQTRVSITKKDSHRETNAARISALQLNPNSTDAHRLNASLFQAGLMKRKPN